MYKVLIVEDEFSIALDIRMRLQDMGYEVVQIAKNYEQALKYAQQTNPDIVLMDINLSQGKSGIEAAKDIYEAYQIPVVFLTAYRDDATFEQALLSQPFGYVVKPFIDKDLNFTLQVALKKSTETTPTQEKEPPVSSPLKDTLFIKDKSQLIAIKLQEILWVEALGNYALIITPTKKVVANLSLKNIENKLPQHLFLKVHRSCIIALEKVEKIKDNCVYINNTPISVSKSYKSQLLEKLKIL
ncbi:hypothetical protein BKI52_41210 [marine bacterium AO1-C]|nr:hypothetical protein BKI52_41210 [marine bacterium AO1-C]